MKKSILVDVCTMVLVGILAYASITKILGLKQFFWTLNFAPGLRRNANWLQYMIPSVEILLAIAILIHQTRLVGFLGIALLSIIYITAQLTLRYYIPNIRGGILNQLAYNDFLLLNASIFATSSIGGLVLFTFKRKIKNQQPIPAT